MRNTEASLVQRSSVICLSLGVFALACSSASSRAASEGSTAGSSSAVAGHGGTDPVGAGRGGQIGAAADDGGSSHRDNGGVSNGGSSDGGAGGAGEPRALDIAAIIADYHSYHPQTDQPESVSDYIFGLCRLPTLPERAFAKSEHGDSRYLQDWANDLAVEGIARRGDPAFAPGAVIVKEKYVPAAPVGQFELVALGFMIKRSPGFAPSAADWEYGYWEPELGVISTAEQSAYCAGCHAGAVASDTVFVDGLVP